MHQITHITYSKTVKQSCGDTETVTLSAVLPDNNADLKEVKKDLKKKVEELMHREAVPHPY